MISSERKSELDFLRGIAILLVLFRHFPLCLYTYSIGWIGVDLFFVLSGFLVSGLLFSEYRKSGTLKPVKFLIRRGFKIYPLFYCLLIFRLIQIPHLQTLPVLGELFFLQNYLGALSNHTWSLAVEEHFYFALTILLFVIAKRKLLENQFLFYLLTSAVVIGCLGLRISANIRHPEHLNFFETHLRFDSLFSGVLLSYLYHFRKDSLFAFARNNKKMLLAGSAGLLSFTPFIEPATSFFVKTIGFSLVFIAFCFLLTVIITTENVDKKISRYISVPIYAFICKTGYYSYSIYIVHMIIAYQINNFEDVVDLSQPIYFIIYFCCSILTGIALSHLIEMPFLKIRDKYFPAELPTTN